MKYRIVLAALVLLFFACHAQAKDVTFDWTPSPSPTAIGNELACGPTSGAYTTVIDVKNVSTYKWLGFSPDADYYCAVRAYDATTPPQKSPWSNEVKITHNPPAPPTGLKATIALALQNVRYIEKQITDATTLKKLRSIERTLTTLLAAQP